MNQGSIDTFRISGIRESVKAVTGAVAVDTASAGKKFDLYDAALRMAASGEGRQAKAAKEHRKQFAGASPADCADDGVDTGFVQALELTMEQHGFSSEEFITDVAIGSRLDSHEQHKWDLAHRSP